jgi:DNA-binding CsgD family transcriptional regulator
VPWHKGAVPPTKTLASSLAELRSCARARQRRPTRVLDVAPLLARLIGGCRTLSMEERGPGLAFRLAGTTERQVPFGFTCILHAAPSPVQLTTAERAVADLLCEGHTLAQIARRRGVSSNTVKSQVRQIFRKLDVDSRVALVRHWCP